jgi:hypothetical protein
LNGKFVATLTYEFRDSASLFGYEYESSQEHHENNLSELQRLVGVAANVELLTGQQRNGW